MNQSLMFRSARRAHDMVIILMLSLLAQTAAAAPDWDILGIKLGMTESEVREALAAYDSNGQILAFNESFSYSDKVNSFRSPEFLNQLELRVTKPRLQIPLRVWFSGPTGESRVIGVARQQQNISNPVSAAQFQESLNAKYGEPSGAAGTMPVWEEKNKASCVRSSWGVNLLKFPQITSGQMSFSSVVGTLERELQSSNTGLPTDLADCGAVLHYSGGMDPVRSITGGLFDLGAMISTQRSRQAWVKQLEAEAIAKREGQAQAPRL